MSGNASRTKLNSPKQASIWLKLALIALAILFGIRREFGRAIPIPARARSEL
jgi:hypothetical protein